MVTRPGENSSRSLRSLTHRLYAWWLLPGARSQHVGAEVVWPLGGETGSWEGLTSETPAHKWEMSPRSGLGFWGQGEFSGELTIRHIVSTAALVSSNYPGGFLGSATCIWLTMEVLRPIFLGLVPCSLSLSPPPISFSLPLHLDSVFQVQSSVSIQTMGV